MKLIQTILLSFSIASINLSAAEPIKLPVDLAASSLIADVKATGHSFECVLKTYSVELDFDTNEQAITGAQFSAKTMDLSTDKEKRDKKMRDWMHAEQFPEFSCELTQVIPDGEGFIATGTFTLSGKTQPIEIPFAFTIENDSYALTGTARLNTHDFDLPTIRLLFFTVDPEMTIHINLKGSLPEMTVGEQPE
jgi:cytochrome b561